MKIVAIIPARGGSKGVPKKNIRMLNGKPLLAWMIEAALRAKLVNKIRVSTNDEEIKRVAHEYGALIVNRPEGISGDLASAESVLLHTLNYLKESEKYEPDIIVFLQCTSPLTTSEDIDRTIQTLIEEDADSALSVVPFHYFIWDNHGNGVNHDKRVRFRRQERSTQFVETGGVYVMRTKGFLGAKHRFFGKTVTYNCGNHPHIEIDEPDDLIIAEALLKERENGTDRENSNRERIADIYHS